MLLLQDRADAVHFPSDDPPGGHAIAFNNVTFSYRPDQPILQVTHQPQLLSYVQYYPCRHKLLVTGAVRTFSPMSLSLLQMLPHAVWRPLCSTHGRASVVYMSLCCRPRLLSSLQSCSALVSPGYKNEADFARAMRVKLVSTACSLPLCGYQVLVQLMSCMSSLAQC